MTIIEAFCDDVTASADKGSATDLIYFDFSKNFDVIPHKILLCKLEREQAERRGCSAWRRDGSVEPR